MKHLKNITKNQAIFFAIAGLILGTVLTFGVKYWNVPIKEEDAWHITATFSSYKETKRKGHIQEIIIQFKCCLSHCED